MILNIKLVFLILNLYALAKSEKGLKFTNIKCNDFEPTFSTFKSCELKMVKRGVPALSVHLKLFQPVNNISINLDLMKKANGYRPFLYNVTTDFCSFMKNRNRQPFLKIIFDTFLQDSNINHTCPYQDDLYIRNMILQDIRNLPLPEGYYLVKITLGCYNDWKSDIKVYFVVKE